MKSKQPYVTLVEAARRLLGSLAGDSEPPSAPLSSLRQYRTAVEIAWADGELNGAERDRLDALARELGLSESQVAEIEREAMNASGPISPPVPAPTTDSGNLLDNRPWVDLVEECVELVEELDRQMAHFDPPRQELADHVVLRLEEVLQRSGVEVISEDTAFDRGRHKLAKADTRIAPGAVITETLSPGFAIGPRVLRRARVQVE